MLASILVLSNVSTEGVLNRRSCRNLAFSFFPLIGAEMAHNRCRKPLSYLYYWMLEGFCDSSRWCSLTLAAVSISLFGTPSSYSSLSKILFRRLQNLLSLNLFNPSQAAQVLVKIPNKILRYESLQVRRL